MSRGIFISMEGPDGSGKSTQIELIKEYLEKEGKDVIITREPGGTRISEAIREIILNKDYTEMSPVTEMMLYAAARAQLVTEVIKPAINEGKVVICDRFLDSSLAYQSYGRGLGDAVLQVNQYAVDGCMPDVTIYLRVDPRTGRQRIRTREQDRIESESERFHDRVHDGYEQLCLRYPDRITAIDAGGTIEEISQAILAEVTGKINEISRGNRE